MISYVVPAGTLPTQRALFKTKQKPFIATCYLPNYIQTLHPNIQWPSLYGLWTSLTPFHTPPESAKLCVPHWSWNIPGIPPHEWLCLFCFLRQNALHSCPHSLSLSVKTYFIFQANIKSPIFCEGHCRHFYWISHYSFWIFTALSCSSPIFYSIIILPLRVLLLFCSICL